VRLLLPLLLALFGCRAEAAPGAAPCEGCNVLWITIDTTRADRMGYLGNKNGLTPNIDKLAARGTAWAHAISQAPETSLSVSSFLSGRYRHNNGMDFYLSEKARIHQMSDEVTTVAEALKGAGFKAVGYTANPVIGKGENFNLNVWQGFDTWLGGTDAQVTERAVKALELFATSQQRFFVYAHLMGPHTDNDRTEGFEARRGHFDTQLGNLSEATYAEFNSGRRIPTAQDVAYIKAMYDDALWAADALVGRMVQTLDDKGLRARTLIVITSDHGETLGEPGYQHIRLGHTQALAEELVRVPLVLAGKGVPAGKLESTRVAENVDLAPTLATLLGVPIDPAWRWDGENLFGPGGPGISERGEWALREVSARIPGTSFVTSPSIGWKRYYDLVKDPHQLSPVAAQAAHAALEQRVAAYLKDARPPTVNGANAAPGASDIEMLKAMGYAE
jgi:arylsulfatase A-like enzyme